jgi:hypothetical protein
MRQWMPRSLDRVTTPSDALAAVRVAPVAPYVARWLSVPHYSRNARISVGQ